MNAAAAGGGAQAGPRGRLSPCQARARQAIGAASARRRGLNGPRGEEPRKEHEGGDRRLGLTVGLHEQLPG